MQNFDDVIELLLHKKANLRAELEREFADRAAKIDLLLDTAGYVPPEEENDNSADVQASSETETVIADE